MMISSGERPGIDAYKRLQKRNAILVLEFLQKAGDSVNPDTIMMADILMSRAALKLERPYPWRSATIPPRGTGNQHLGIIGVKFLKI